MIGAVMRKELRGMLRDGRGIVLLLGFLVILCGAIAQSSHRHAQVADEKASAAEATRKQWDKQGEKHPHRGAHFGQYVFRPETALSAFDPGLNAYMGQALWLEPHRRNLSRFDPTADALPGARFGELSPAFVLSVLLPLLLIALGYACVSEESESGTLRMLQGVGASAKALLLGKALALACVAAALLLFAFALLLLLAWPRDSDALIRSALLFAGSMGYAAIFSVLTVTVSAWLKNGRLALFALIALWGAWAFVVPRIGAAAVSDAVPMPSAPQFWEAIHLDYTQGLPGDGPLEQRVKAFETTLLHKHRVERLEDLPVGANALRRLFRDAYANKVHELHFARLWERQERQQEMLSLFAWLSPAVAMQSLSMAFSGTDLAHQRRFEDSAESYRQSVNRQIDEWDTRHTRGIASYDARYADDALWRSVKPFHYQSPPVGFALAHARFDVAALAAWLLLAVAGLRASARSLSP